VHDGGYALLVVMMMATLLLISLTAALPSVYQEGQREREEELIFRGNEYARAVMLFNRQFQRYPTSVKELLETNGMRFLRREYADPMSKTGRWRFIHAGPNGVILDSKTLGPVGGGMAAGMGGNQLGGLGSLGQPSFGSSQFGTSSSPGQSSFGGSGFGSQGQSSFGSSQFGSSGFSGQSSFGASQSGGQNNQQQTSISSAQQPGATDESGEKAEESAFFGPSNQPMGSSIVGVASTSKKQSIRIFNGRKRYNEWEFLGVATGMGAIPGGMPPQPNQAIPSQQTTQPGVQPGQQTTPATQPSLSGPQPPQPQDIPPLTDEPMPEPEQ
jgi:type II secretory pathway pseudopilin PulG